MAAVSITPDFLDREFAILNEKHNFGIEKLKEEQKRVITSILNGRDTVGILPTGFGKSIVFYVLPMLKEKVSKHFIIILQFGSTQWMKFKTSLTAINVNV